jgi:hypothetical protein
LPGALRGIRNPFFYIAEIKIGGAKASSRVAVRRERANHGEAKCSPVRAADRVATAILGTLEAVDAKTSVSRRQQAIALTLVRTELRKLRHRGLPQTQ